MNALFFEKGLFEDCRAGVGLVAEATSGTFVKLNKEPYPFSFL